MSKTYFISYNKNDLAWAEWVGWVVEDLGAKVIIQAWDFTPGKSWVQEMHDATNTSDCTICILSEDFLKSGFAAAEWQAAFADDPTGKERKIIPIRVKTCQPDGLLKTRIYTDLVGLDKDSAKSLIKQTLLEGRNKPKSEPNFPPDHGSEPQFPSGTVRYAFVLDGVYDRKSKDQIEMLLKHLQRKVNDPSITITEITDGSMILHLESSYDSFRRLQKEFLDNKDLSINNKQVLGIWTLLESTSHPVDQRLEFYRDRLIGFFLSKGADKETSKDLAQDVIINLYTDENRYKYLSSSALTINLARIAFSKSVSEKDKDLQARRGYVNPSGDIDWDEVYRASTDVLNNLSQDDHFILEQYWDSKFAEGKFDHIRENDAAALIDESVEYEININIRED